MVSPMSNAAATDFHEPGFYLLDDAEGRFVVDHDTGVVMLSDESILDDEMGQIHGAQLLVIENSGLTYTVDLTLRLTGRVPQMAGSEDLLEAFGVVNDPLAQLPYRTVEVCDDADEDIEDEAHDEDVVRIVSWAGYSATKGYIKPHLGSEHAPFGALIELWIPSFGSGFASLTMVDDVPPANSRTAIWSV